MFIYTDKELSDAVKTSKSINGVIATLGSAHNGFRSRKVRKDILRLHLDTSHFNPYGEGIPKPKDPLPWEECLVNRPGGTRRTTRFLRAKMIESGIQYTCARCPVDGRWNGKSIRLEINHKNGDKSDDRKENLEFLCPNCHSQDPHSRRSC